MIPADDPQHVPDLTAIGLMAIDKASARKLFKLKPISTEVVMVGPDAKHGAIVNRYRTSKGVAELWTSNILGGTMYRFIPD